MIRIGSPTQTSRLSETRAHEQDSDVDFEEAFKEAASALKMERRMSYMESLTKVPKHRLHQAHNGQTLLYIAAKNGRMKACEYIIKTTADEGIPVSESDRSKAIRTAENSQHAMTANRLREYYLASASQGRQLRERAGVGKPTHIRGSMRREEPPQPDTRAFAYLKDRKKLVLLEPFDQKSTPHKIESLVNGKMQDHNFVSPEAADWTWPCV